MRVSIKLPFSDPVLKIMQIHAPSHFVTWSMRVKDPMPIPQTDTSKLPYKHLICICAPRLPRFLYPICFIRK